VELTYKKFRTRKLGSKYNLIESFLEHQYWVVGLIQDVVFVGELYNRRLLPESIIHYCLKGLLLNILDPPE
jgi:hypothetical protein